MSKRTGRKPKRERTSRRRTRHHSSTSESSEDAPPPPPPTPKSGQKNAKTRASSRVQLEAEKKVALTIKLPKPADGNDGGTEENATGMWKVERANGSDGDIQKLKISLCRSPKDLLREQAAEEKRKEKQAVAGSSHSSAAPLDGSVTSYLEQFGSAVAVEETEQTTTVDSTEQVQVITPTNVPLCVEENAIKIGNDDRMDSSGVSSEIIAPQNEPVVESTSNNDNVVVCEEVCDLNEIREAVKDPITLAVESIKPCSSPEDTTDPTVPSSINAECPISQNDKSIDVSEIDSSVVTEIIPSNVEIPVVLSESIQKDETESIVNVVSESNTVEITKEENVSTTADTTEVAAIVSIEKSKPTDAINDSEQMEDVVQLTVESPDLVDDEDHKQADEEEPKPIHPEELTSSVEDEANEPVGEDDSKSIGKEETKLVEESSQILPSSADTSKRVDVEKDFVLEETPKLLSSLPKRKWGSCKTRTPITICPFTLGTIIDSNGDSIGDNGEYRSEEGEIQRTDSEVEEEEEEEEVDEPMDVNDTMLVDHEAVDYEAPEEEEEKLDNNNDDSKSEKSLTEEIIEKRPKKKSSVKRATTSNVIRITNLVRPFTVGQLRDLLQRTGTIVSNGFWIDTIKSQCIVEYENEDQAIETVYALNESQWPSTNPKVLRVVFTDREELNKALNGTHPDRLVKPKESSKMEKYRTQLDNHIILREWDRGKLEDMNGEKEDDKDKPVKRKITDDLSIQKEKKLRKDDKNVLDKRRKSSKSKTPERIPTKSLDELFRKTKTTPTLYWSPLSLEQITEKEDQRRKHLAEMERSQKPDRRRRDINHFPRRR